MVPHSTQYKTLFPEITMPCYHQGPLINHSNGKPYPRVPCRRLQPSEQDIPWFSCSLLFNGEELARLKRKEYQIFTFRREKPHSSSPEREEQLSFHSSGGMSDSSSKDGEPPKTSGKSPGTSSPLASPDSTSSKKSSSSHSKSSLRVKEWHEKESHSRSSKHKDKLCGDKSSKHSSDKDATKSSRKCRMSPPSQPSSTERAGKECHLGDTIQTLSTDTCGHPQSPSKCMSESEDQVSFTPTSSTSTPNKIGSIPHFCSNSSDSRCSMNPLDTLLYGSFSVAGSQWVTSSMWQPPGPFYPPLTSAMDTLSARQDTEIYQLATECQALGAELTKQFQNLSGLEAVHCPTAQATAHETINARCMAHNAAFSAITTNQPDVDCKEFLHQFHAEADQAWKDTNDIIFSHHDAQLAAFITTAEGTLQAKQDEI